MRIGVFSILYNDIPLDEVLINFKRLGLQSIELGGGGYSKSNHALVDDLLSSDDSCEMLLNSIHNAGLEISAISVHGNPVHPNKAIADLHHQEFVNGCILAQKLKVDKVLVLSGTPGGNSKDVTPNWITCPWPDDFLNAYKYQWEDVLIPYWQVASKIANENGIFKIGMEMHPGMCVYNPATLLKLREAVGPIIGCNFDPSHLFWQGIDISEAIYALKECIFHFHAKDNSVNKNVVETNGPLSALHYGNFMERPWTFRSVGFGHSEIEWKKIIQSLQFIGYDGTISIEHEDALMSRNEGFERSVRFLQSVINKECLEDMWWA